MNDQLWIDKYKPKCLSEIIGNKTTIKNIDKYFNNIKKNNETNKIIMLTGSSGIGKSIIARLILEKYKYRIIELNSSEIKGNMNSILQNTINYKNVLEMFMNDNRISGIIIEEIETLCVLGAKSNLNDLIDIIKKSKKKKTKECNRINIPIILTCNLYTEKKIKELKSLVVEFKLKKPTKLTLEKFLKNIIIKENININNDILKSLIIEADGDVRRAITLLYDIKISSKMNIITNNIKIDKNNDLQLYDSIKKIFNKKQSFDILEEIYYLEPFFIPLIIHENYIDIILNRIGSNKIKSIINCSNYLMISDMYNSDIILNQYYQIQQYMPYFSNIPVNREIIKFTINSNIIDEYNSTKLFNRLSFKTLRYNKIITLLLNIKNPNIFYIDLVYFYKIISQYLYKTKDLKYLSEIIKYYNIDIDNLEKIIKLYQKNSLSLILKKELNSIMN